MGPPAFQVERLSVAYGGRRALEEVTFSLPRGAMLGVVGPNGGGKSTLVKALLGLVRPGGGKVEVLGGKLDRLSRRRIGYVPQREEVNWNFPLSTLDVVLMGRVPSLKLLRRPDERDRRLAREALQTVGMGHHSGTRIRELSGGQQQRVFLARALAQEAEILLLDEPVSGVDAPTQHEIFDLLHRLQAAGKTIVVTTHDLSCVAERFDLALLLNRRAVALGKPAEVFTKELLNEAYQSHLMMLDVDGRTVAVERGGEVG
ncbi:metal ABC transporter ATP-binding protein [Rubrobacter aplysinae]|uniref:metal ABC transporter ATP-binding protein n=1 Tax=Rubrobacter aplysinae TaxID=909625 RepID=UPI00064B8D24|nr:metal ABC transporter ATP-binding protein [Rubrobacter aplysinae]